MTGKINFNRLEHQQQWTNYNIPLNTCTIVLPMTMESFVTLKCEGTNHIVVEISFVFIMKGIYIGIQYDLFIYFFFMFTYWRHNMNIQ